MNSYFPENQHKCHRFSFQPGEYMSGGSDWPHMCNSGLKGKRDFSPNVIFASHTCNDSSVQQFFTKIGGFRTFIFRNPWICVFLDCPAATDLRSSPFRKSPKTINTWATWNIVALRNKPMFKWPYFDWSNAFCLQTIVKRSWW